MVTVQTSSYFTDDVPMIALKSLFQKYDADENGRLDKSELYKLLKDDLGMDDDQAETYRYYLDQDADSTVSFEEFEKWFHSGEKFQNINDKSRYHHLRKAVQMFQKYDVDKNLAIDSKEFHNLFLESGGVGKKEEAALKELDIDNNGLVSFQEFLKWLNWVPLEGLKKN